MKMILSSCDFSRDASRQCILDHLPHPIGQCRVLFVPNEKADSQKINSGKYHRRLQNDGFSEKNIYVFDETHAADFENLDLDIIYVSGGNTFLTMHKLRSCGFDRILVSYIRNGVTYIGGSAGAHLVTKDLAHVSCYDPVPRDMTDLSGLGLFDGILFCHVDRQRKADAQALMHDCSVQMILLRDDDSIVIEKRGGGECIERYPVEKGT